MKAPKMLFKDYGLCILFSKFLSCVLETWEQYSYYVAPYMFSDGAKMK